MKVEDIIGAVFEVVWAGAIVFLLLTLIGFKDLFVEIFTAAPETGGVIAWATSLIFAVHTLKFIKLENLSKVLKDIRWTTHEP